MSGARLASLVCLVLALAGCTPMAVRPPQDTAALLAAQQAREQQLAPRVSWTVEARFGVSNGEDGGSGSLTWVAQPDQYSFTFRGPVSARSFVLRGNADGAVIEGLEHGPYRGTDAESLLADVFGWRVPMAELRYWVRGMRAPGSPAEIEFNAAGLPAVIRQDGWTVEYRDWYEYGVPLLPYKVFAERGPYRVRVAIRRWVLQ